MGKQGEQGGIDREQETKNFCANTGGTLKSTGLCAKPANTKAQAWHEINVGCWSETYRLLDPMNGYNPPDLSRHPYPHPAGQRAVSKLKPGPRYPLQLRIQLRYPPSMLLSIRNTTRVCRIDRILGLNFFAIFHRVQLYLADLTFFFR